MGYEIRDERSQRTGRLKDSLERQRGAIRAAMSERIRNVSISPDVRATDLSELSFEDLSGDIDFALLTMQTETLEKIAGALARLDDGEYGDCMECGAEIPARRLEALPFAVRCLSCEQKRELRRERRQAHDELSARLARHNRDLSAAGRGRDY
jgi:DnaK suppressor protein